MSEELWNRIREEYEKAATDPTYDTIFEMEGKRVEVGVGATFTKGVIIIIERVANDAGN